MSFRTPKFGPLNIGCTRVAAKLWSRSTANESTSENMVLGRVRRSSSGWSLSPDYSRRRRYVRSDG